MLLRTCLATKRLRNMFQVVAGNSNISACWQRALWPKEKTLHTLGLTHTLASMLLLPILQCLCFAKVFHHFSHSNFLALLSRRTAADVQRRERSYLYSCFVPQSLQHINEANAMTPPKNTRDLVEAKHTKAHTFKRIRAFDLLLALHRPANMGRQAARSRRSGVDVGGAAGGRVAATHCHGR